MKDGRNGGRESKGVKFYCKKNKSWDITDNVPASAVVKNPPASAGDTEVQVQSLGWQDPLEKEMATHSSILSWRIPWTEEPGGLYSPWSHRVGYD